MPMLILVLLRTQSRSLFASRLSSVNFEKKKKKKVTWLPSSKVIIINLRFYSFGKNHRKIFKSKF